MEDRLDSRLRNLPQPALHAILARVAEIDEFKGWWRGRDLPVSAVRSRLVKRTVRISSAASTRIGAGPLARPAGGASRGIGAGKPGDRRTPWAAAYAELLREVFSRHREMAFGTDLVLALHARLVKYPAGGPGWRVAGESPPGRGAPLARRGIESIALRPADPHRIPQEMAAATGWAASRLASPGFHPLLVIAAFILEFLAIRPFADGNGRVSRILTNFLLLRGGYSYVPFASLERAIDDRRTEYYLALRRSQALRNLPQPEISAWIIAFLDAMKGQIGELREATEGRPAEGRLSGNQSAVLELLVRNREVTNRLVRRELGLPRDTAKQVLARLVALNAVRRAGAGRAARYRLLQDQEPGASAR